MNIPFTGFQVTLIVWGAITTAILTLVPPELENFGIVIFSMFICLLVGIGIHDISVYNERDRWLQFKESKRK